MAVTLARAALSRRRWDALLRSCAIALGLSCFRSISCSKSLDLAGRGPSGHASPRTRRRRAFAPEGFRRGCRASCAGARGRRALIAFGRAAGWRRPAAAAWRRSGGPTVTPRSSSRRAAAHSWRALWDLLRGAAQLKNRRRRNWAGATWSWSPRISASLDFVSWWCWCTISMRDAISSSRSSAKRGRRELVSARARPKPPMARRAEVFDLSGVARDYLAACGRGALAVPVVCEPAVVTFAPEAYWRGETHRICDRPGARRAGAGGSRRPRRRADPRRVVGSRHARAARALAAAARRPRPVRRVSCSRREAAAVRDAMRSPAGPVRQVFTIRPVHNPIGPFDLAGGFDDRSDRCSRSTN